MPTCRLSLLGPPRIEVDGHLVGITSRKALGMLAYLAVTGQPHGRKHLADLLWPETDAAHARGALRAILTALRRAFGDAWIAAEGDTLRLRLPYWGQRSGAGGQEATDDETTIWLDVACFRAEIAATRAHAHAANAPCLECRARLSAAANLYRADFLTDFSVGDAPDFDIWQTCQTESLRLELAEALERLAETHAACGDSDAALDAARRWVALDPLHEPAHRCVMRLHAATGDRRAALQQYTACREALAKELGIAPEPETLALYERIKSGAIARPRPVDVPVITSDRGWPRPSITLPSGAFFGREQELAQIGQCLADPACRLLTIVGPGGAGKTLLARHAAAAHADHFPDGTCFVPLITVLTPDHVPSAISQALNLLPGSGADPLHQLCHNLRELRMILVLDSFEHLITDDGQTLTGTGWLPTLLDAASGLKLIVTSRERLNLHNEWLLPLRGLALPPSDQRSIDGVMEGKVDGTMDSTAAIDAFPAIQLFRHCARRGGSVLQPDVDQLHLIARICRLVDGLPLAIELITAWVRVLPLAEIAARLETGIELLRTAERDIPLRHRSMRAVFDQSWGLLSARDRSILRQLSVFRGGFSAEAAQAIAQASLSDLAELAGKSWLQTDATGRFALLELVGQYCAEKLTGEHVEATGENADQVRERHSAYYLSLLDRQPQAPSTWQDQYQALYGDLDNLREIWPRAIERGDLPTMRCLLALLSSADVSTRLSVPLFESAIQELESGIARGSDSGFRQDATILLARLLCNLGRLHARQGQLGRAASRVQAGLDLLAGTPRSRGWVEADFLLRRERGLVAVNRGDFGAALREVDALRDLLPEIHTQLWPYSPDRSLPFWQVELSGLRFFALHRLGRYDEARQSVARSLRGLAQIPWACNSLALANLGELCCLQGEFAEGLRLGNESLRSNQAHKQRALSSLSLLIMAVAESGLGRAADAHEHLRRAITLSRAYEHPAYLTRSMVALARLELQLGRPARARELCEEAAATFQRLGLEWEHISAMVSTGLGWSSLALPDPAAAEMHFRQALCCRVRQANDTMDAMAGIAQARADTGDAIRAAELAALVAAHAATGHTVRQQMSALLAKLNARLSQESFAEAVERGQALKLDEVIAGIADPPQR